MATIKKDDCGFNFNVNGKDYVGIHTLLEFDSIIPDTTNPRFTTEIILKGKSTLTADNIRNLLFEVEKEETLSLRRSIDKNNGIMEPILTIRQKDGKFKVIEGNRRYFCIESLRNEKPSIWQTYKIPSYVFPNLNDDEIKILLGIIHVQGKKDWNAWSRGYYIYIMCQKKSQDDIADLLGIAKQEVIRACHTVKGILEAQKYTKEPINRKYSQMYEFIKAGGKDMINKLAIDEDRRKLAYTTIASGCVQNNRGARNLAAIIMDPKGNEKLKKLKPQEIDQKIIDKIAETIPTRKRRPINIAAKIREMNLFFSKNKKLIINELSNDISDTRESIEKLNKILVDINEAVSV